MQFRYLAIPSLLGLAALLCLLPGASATYYPGDLVISGVDNRNNETIDIVGSILFEPGASAFWQDIQITFNSTSPSAHGLYIDGAANFQRVTITALENTTLWWFKVNATGALTAEECDFGWMNGTGSDPGASGTASGTNFASLVGGVQIYSSFVFIGNSSIHDGLGTNVYVLNAAPRLNRNHIFAARYLFFEYSTSYLAPRQTSDFRGVAVCVVASGGAVDLDRNRIDQCGSYGSANITDLGSSGATQATSNIRLVGAGVVALGGTPSLRLQEIQNVTTATPAARSFTLTGVAVTHNLFKIASWGQLYKQSAGATVAGGYIASADIGIEILADGAYAGGAISYDIFALTFNGTYLTGLTAVFASHSQAVTLSMDSCTFNAGASAAVNVVMNTLSAAHTVSITGSTFDLNTASGTGVMLYDSSSSGKPTLTVSSNTMSHSRAPISIGLQGLTGGATVTASNNFMDRTAGAQNGSASPTNRGGIDIRWISLSGGTIAVVTDDNRVYNQTWTVGPYPGITLYSSGASNLITSIAVRRNQLSNISDGVFLYDNYAGGQSATYNFTRNLVENALNNYGIFIQDVSSGGSLDPALDWNTIDRANSYAVYFQVTSAIVTQRTFGNNTVYGTGVSRCCGMYFLYGVNTKWPMIIADSLISNTSYGLIFSQIIANIYRTDVSNNNNGTQCSECIAHFYESSIYPLSALVSGAQSEVVAYQRFGSPRVQWQGDGGNLIPLTNVNLIWIGPASPQTLATVTSDSLAMVQNRSLQAWRKTATQGDTYQNLTPSIRWNSLDIPGLTLPFQAPFYGNITILDPELPIITVTSPGPGSQVRARSVHVKGQITDQVSGVHGIQISIDGVNFADVTLGQGNTWEADVTFPADGVYNIVLHGWDEARWAITFGDYTSGFGVYNITGIVIDTQPPRLEITNPPVDITTRATSFAVTGIVSDLNSIALFQFSYKGSVIPVVVSAGNFNVTVQNLSEGPNLISVLATDLAGNTNVTTRTIVVDTVPPHLNIYAPLNNSFTNRAAIEISADVEQDVVVLVNGVVASFPYTLPLRTNPPLNKIWINATDRGANQLSIELWVTLDRTPPTLTFTSPVRFPFYTRDPRVVVQGLANEPLSILVVNDVTYPLSGTDPRAFSFELYLEDGSHDVRVHVVDLANNTYEVNASPIVVDTQAPSLRVDSPSDRSVTPSRTLTFRGRTDANAFLNVTTPSGTTIWDINPVTGEFTFTDTRISDGVFPYLFEASDAVGNKRGLTITITIDTTKPNLELLSPPPPAYTTPDEVVNFHGTVSQGAVLELTVDSPDNRLDLSSAPVAVTCSGPSGADCQYNFNLKVADGQTVIQLVATDLAGNTQVKEVFVRSSFAAQTTPVAPPSNSPVLAIVGAVLGLATLPIWLLRFRARARAADPGLLEREKAGRAGRAAPEVAAPEPIEAEADMYADDAMARRPGGY